MFILFPHSALENDALREVVDKQGYQIVMTEAELNGPERFAADNVISDDMCRELIDLALVSHTHHCGVISHVVHVHVHSIEEACSDRLCCLSG